MDESTREMILDLMQYGYKNRALLAHKYGVTERTIRRRIDIMVKTNKIKFIVTPNIVLLGHKAWARVGIKVKLGSLNRVARALVAHPMIYWVALTLGRFDIMISVHFNSIDELAYFINSELMKFRDIQDIETILQVFPRKYNLFNWPAPVYVNRKSMLMSHENVTDSQGYYELLEVEQKILDILMSEGPARPKTLALKLGISGNIIRRYLKAMSINELFKIESVFAPGVEVMEQGTHAYIGIVTRGQYPDQIIDSILEHPGVYFASLAIGRFNILVGTRFRNPELLSKFLTEFLPSIPGIGSTETYLIVKLLKYHGITWPIS